MPQRAATRSRARKRAVLAFGGNALIRHGEDGDQRRQISHAEAAMTAISK